MQIDDTRETEKTAFRLEAEAAQARRDHEEAVRVGNHRRARKLETWAAELDSRAELARGALELGRGKAEEERARNVGPFDFVQNIMAGEGADSVLVSD